VGIINGVNFSSVFPAFSKGYAIFITLAILCLAKFYLKVAFRFGISLIILQMIVQSGDLWVPANSLFLMILSIAQLIGSISFDYGSEAVHSESKLENKVIRLVLLMCNVGLLTYAQNDTYIHLVSVALFLGVFISKASSLIKN
jgi:sugar phosphate permease